MKLAEALVMRADYQKRLAQLKIRLNQNAKVQEDEKPAEDPQELLLELDSILDEMTDLVQRINGTNSVTMFDDEMTLTDALAERDKLLFKKTALSEFIQASVIKQDRYSKSEVKFLATANVAEMQKQVDKLAKEFRELDTKIQELNWKTDLI